MDDRFQVSNVVLIHAAAGSLVGIRRVSEPIAHHPQTCAQIRLNVIGKMHRARREHEQQFRHRRQRLITWMQDQLANFFRQRGAAGLPGNHVRYAAFGKSFRKPRHLGGFTHAFDSLDGQEAHCSTRHRADSDAAL